MTACLPVAPGRVSLVVADFMRLPAEDLKQALKNEPSLSLLGWPTRIGELERIVTEQRPNVVLIRATDLKATLSVLAKLSRLCSSTRLIVMSSELTRNDVVAYFHAQVRGILPAELTDSAVVLKCITCVDQGQIWASSEQLGYLVESLSPMPFVVTDANAQSVLSAREQEIVQLLTKGMSNRALAIALNLSEHTIKNHLFHIFSKLGVSTRTEAILYATGQRPYSCRTL